MVLYQKYRPQTFSEVVGQENVVKTLENEIISNSISHAYLFCGPKGTGKTSVARILAKAVNCENRHGAEPCNKCPSCVSINNGQAVDLVEIDAASNRGIDNIRDLKKGIRFAPTKLKYKVFIIDESHQLSKDAANALLKVLEEPPSHTIFILATTDPQKMIPTIVSRCQRFDFRRLTVSEITNKLKSIAKKEGIKISEAGLKSIAVNSDGALRDAENLLEQVMAFTEKSKEKDITKEEVENILGIVNTNLISSLINYLIAKDTKKSVELINQIIKKGFDPEELTKSLVDYLHHLLILKINPQLENSGNTNLTKEEIEEMENQIEKITEDDIRKMIELFLEAEKEIRYSSIPQLPIEMSAIKIIGGK